MEQLDPAFWRSYFTVYDRLNDFLPYASLIEEIANAAAASPEARVLDAGTGTGNLAAALASRGAIVTGIDFCAEVLAIASTKVPTGTFIEADLREPLPFGAGQFDLVVSNNALYCLAAHDMDQLVREFYRVLRPGGRTALSNPTPAYGRGALLLSHLGESQRRSGIVTAFCEFARLAPDLLRIASFDRKIDRAFRGGSARLLRSEDQEGSIAAGGFVNLASRPVYAGQAVLTIGSKLKME